MRFCADHWAALRAAIDQRGLKSLVAEGGERAVANLVSEMQDGPSIDTFDPLMAAHNSIWGNAMELARRGGADPLAMLNGDAPPEIQCPVCFLNKMMEHHDANCTQEGCDWPKGYRYEWMIDRAADDSLEAWKALAP